MPSYLKSKTFLHKNDKQRSRFFLSGSLAGQAFFISKIKNLIQKKSIRIVSAITLIALTSSLFFSSQAQGVNFAFIQTDWSGGVTASIATHTDNQTGWNQFSQKDSNITTVNDEVNLNIQLSTGATGGTITYTDLNGLNPRTSPAYPGGYTVHTFTSSGAFINNSNKDADYLVVAGGGGGSTGSNGGGGGGAGGMRTGVFSLTSQSYAVTIGAGGNGAIHTGAGTNGADSIFSTITSIGGGGGTINSNGVSGGSGSGAPASRSAYLGGSGFGGQGNAGGNNRSLSPYPGGGGGGASAAGANGAGSQSGKGGDGAASSISGSLVVYAGGGGSGGTFQGSLGGAGGAGGGGAGASSAVNAISGTPNTGGGGGGGWNSDTVNSGAGGSGIVIIRYLTPQSSSSIFGSIISSPYDTTVTGASLSGLQWSGTRPANTDIQFQLRTSADGVTWGPWCGPDAGAGCDSDAYFTDPTGESETIDDTQKDHLNDRYFQYKATLSSSDGLNTPTLGSVTVSYSIINAPTVATQTITNLNSVTATGNADLTDTGGENPTRYIQWGTTSSDYTDQCSADTGSTGTYSCALTNLLPDTIYFYRAKAVNSAGEAVGAEQSFRTLPSEIVVSNPTSDDVVELLADNYIVLDSGTLEAADQVTTHIDVSLTTGSNQITLPDNTAITNTEGGTFDMSAFTIKVQDVRAEIPDSLAAVKVGVSGTNLTFTNNPVAINIYIGSQHNGKTMQVQYQNENETLWHDQTTCVITDGLCNFTTTHATTYSVNGDGSISGETSINQSLPIEATIAITCTDAINLNPIIGTGISTIDAANEATCNVKTNNSNGYKLEWSTASTDLTNANADTISGYVPAIPNTPETWNLDQATAAWGARLKSTSADPDTDTWGSSDGYAGKWLNIDTSAYQIVSRSTETLQTGSDEILQFGAEIGSNKFQPSGTYATSVVLTATTL